MTETTQAYSTPVPVHKLLPVFWSVLWLPLHVFWWLYWLRRTQWNSLWKNLSTPSAYLLKFSVADISVVLWSSTVSTVSGSYPQDHSGRSLDSQPKSKLSGLRTRPQSGSCPWWGPGLQSHNNACKHPELQFPGTSDTRQKYSPDLLSQKMYSTYWNRKCIPHVVVQEGIRHFLNTNYI